MSHKYHRDDGKYTTKNLHVANKCLAIVLVKKARSKKVSNENIQEIIGQSDDTYLDPNDEGTIVQSSEVQKALYPNGYNGKELLQDFKIRNRTCYWNPSLVESIKSLEYKGFFEPSTILVTSAEFHLENLRSAWGRSVLKAPAGFRIERIGEINLF